MSIKWNFSAFLEGKSEEIYSLIVLNTPLVETNLFMPIFRHAQRVICADGAANRLRQLQLAPSLICGDLDSISQDTLEFYNKLQVQVIRLSDQDSTDFEKCLSCLTEDEQVIVICGGVGGRFDHSMATINALYKHTRATERKLYLITPDNFICILTASDTRKYHLIECNQRYEGPSCGIIPINATPATPLVIRTEGLRWNLDGSHETGLYFGGLISSSNLIKYSANSESELAPVTISFPTPHASNDKCAAIWCCQNLSVENITGSEKST